MGASLYLIGVNMKYGKLKVTIDYGDGFLSEETYHAYSFVNEGVNVSALTKITSVDHSAQIHYDVDVMVRPQDIQRSRRSTQLHVRTRGSPGW